MRPMLGWKVIEGKQDFFIFLQTFASLWKFGSVTGDELSISCQSRLAGRSQVHFMDKLLGLALNTFRHFIQYVGRLMHPAPLLRYWAIFFLQGDPEAKRTVADGQLRCGGKPQAFELLKQFTPGLGAFPVTINDSQEFLGAILGGSDQHQHAGSLFIEPDVEVNAVSPPINVALLAQVALAPCLVISFPADFESHDVSGRETGGFLTQDRCQGFTKISSRDSLEIQRRNQCVDAGCPAHKPGQNRTGEPPSVTMPYSRLTNFNGTNSSDYLPLWQMPVAYNQPLSILITPILVELNVVHYLVFDRGLQQLARSFLEQLFEKRFLFIFSSLTERDHFTLWHWRILSFWLPRVRPPRFFFGY